MRPCFNRKVLRDHSAAPAKRHWITCYHQRDCPQIAWCERRCWGEHCYTALACCKRPRARYRIDAAYCFVYTIDLH